ncbi:SAV_2336 N-terminal domain-related protein [Streptomyces sp. NRRL S-244]|uniref:SAV_2336 N-terminal domain-related protein n=1 Tax=Streptomyces sp. NRRL S-244 TaxID=1463897 RepID=UPI000B0D62D0|nr:SAV_2336 N-terminal domain-related protein [Streptomyces sp. NRRL S-244]
MTESMLHRVRGVLSGDDELLDAEELLDALWLAARLPPAAATALARVATAAESRTAAAARKAGAATAEPASGPSSEDHDEDRREKAHPSAATGAGSDAAQSNGLHAAPASAERQAAHTDRAAMAVRTPGVKALEGVELRLGRALRPLKQLRTDALRTELDVDATVSAIAETGLPDAVLRPAKTRWLDLALLVDDGVSMLLWQQLAGELRGLMERCGAFRHVRVHGLDSRDPAGPRLSSRPYGGLVTTLPLSTVHDPSGNTLLLVVSDGVGRAWRDGSMHQALLRAASAGPTAVVHALPQRLWAGSGIHAEPWKVTTRRRGEANRSWHIEDPVLPPELAPYDGVPVPVLATDGSSLGTWARLIGSPEDTAVLPLLTLPGSPVPNTGDRAFGQQDTAGDAEEAVLRFRAAASSDAYRLAAHLAAVAPLPVPAMRLVQHAVTPAVDTSHLAEVFLGGLMHGVDGSENAPHQKAFDFTDETRRVLLGTVPPAELVRTAQAVTTHLAELAGSSAGFPAWLPHPEGPDQVRSGTRGPFGWVDDTLRRRLGVSLPDTSGPEPEPLPSRGELRELPAGFTLDPELTGWRRLSVADPRFERDDLPYDVFAEHGGGWSEVGMFLAHDGEGRVLVVRIPDARQAHELVETEVAALKRMDGVHAPRLMAWDTSHDRPWLAVDCALDGTTEPAPNLRAFTRQQGVLHQAALVAVARQLAKGLSRAHQRRLVHGSLTPHCVLIAGRDVQIARWTTASLDGRSSRYRSRYEPNPLYRAPELEDPATDPTEEADVYALGIVLLEAATGRKGSVDLLEGLRSSNTRLSSDLVAILRACTHTDPARRPSAARLVRAFDSLAHGQGLQRHPLTVTLGLNAELDTVELALESEHRGGQGPHLLCLGRPARVRRDVIGRVLEQLTRQARTGMELILADHDGHSGLARFEGAVSGSAYLNLRDDTTHALSLGEKLKYELSRRRHVLETITTHDDIGMLEDAASENPLLPRLPRLVVAVENFPRILRSAPELLSVMQDAARTGPRLGIHLILFADDLDQRPDAHGLMDMMPTRIDLQTRLPSEGTEPPTEGAALFIPSDPRPLFFTTGNEQDSVQSSSLR